MEQEDSNLLEIMRQYAGVGAQLAKAYGDEQSKLDLARLLTIDCLSDPLSRAEAMRTVAKLEELTKAYEHMFKKYVSAFVEAVTKHLRELPESERLQREAGLLAGLNKQLATQAGFYEARRQWIDAVMKLYELMDRCGASVSFATCVEFHDSRDLDEYRLRMSRIEDAHRREVSIVEERVKRLAVYLTALNPPS